jgi:hypothetical protein
VQLLETLTRPTSISSYGGWAAWSRYDAVHGGYQLMVRNPDGVVSAMGVTESQRPFEVSLGPLPSGGAGAVYARCVNAVKHEGCRLEQLAIESAGARERRLAVPGGGSLFLPALWKDTVAFLRAVPHGGEKPSGGNVRVDRRLEAPASTRPVAHQPHRLAAPW